MVIVSPEEPGHPLEPRLRALQAAGWDASLARRPPRIRRPDVVHLNAPEPPVDADVIHVESDALRALAIRRGAPPERVFTIAPVPVAARPPGPPDGVLRLYSPVPPTWADGPEDALVAVRRLVDRGIAVEFRLPPSGPFLDAVEFARHQLGLEREVIFESDPHGDVLVSAAVSPRSPRSALDAMAAGLPVVQTEELGPAVVVPPRDPDALAVALAGLAADMARRRRLAEEGVRFAAGFTAERQVRLYVELYSAAASVASAARSSTVHSSASDETRASSSS